MAHFVTDHIDKYHPSKLDQRTKTILLESIERTIHDLTNSINQSSERSPELIGL